MSGEVVAGGGWREFFRDEVSPPSEAAAIVNSGVCRLNRGDRATADAPERYQREKPGELIHVDVKGP